MSPKIKKKYVNRGAPLYMSQFTMIMLILIVFFMIMTTMNKSQQGVGKSGDPGAVNNLGLDMEGFGMFRFGAAKAGQQSPNPDPESDKSAQKGVHKNLTEGSGGQGDTDADIKKNTYGKYIVVKFSNNFEKGSANLTPDMEKDLEKYGLIFALMETPVIIKSRTTELASSSANLVLSLKRSTQIMRFLNERCNLDLSQMEASGTLSSKFIGPEENTHPAPAGMQETFFYIYLSQDKDLRLPGEANPAPAAAPAHNK